jgi:hypothetical protein
MARSATRTAPREEIDEQTGEILPMRARADTREVSTNVEFGRSLPPGFAVAKYVSVPMLEVPPGQAFVCQMVDKVRILSPLLDENGNPRPRKIKGDHFASTIKSSNGEARLFTWTTVFRSEMAKAYPDDTYVGKWYQITRLPVSRGKDYSTYAITELTPSD